MPTSVLSVDDDGSLGRRLEGLLRAEDHLLYAGQSTVEAMLSIVAGLVPDVVVIDLTSARDSGGLEAIRAVRRHFPSLQFILLHDGRPGDELLEQEARGAAAPGEPAATMRRDATNGELLSALSNAAGNRKEP
jgi:DNA-binding NtrC family response regulator